MTGTYNRGFCNQEGAGDAEALFVMVLNDGKRHMVAVCPCTGHWSHRNAMAQVHPSDLQGVEELRHLGFGNATKQAVQLTTEKY